VTKGIRYHVGGTRGTSVQGDDETKLIDTGTATITDQRIVFQGQKQAREWAFSKLLGYEHDQHSPWTPIQVSNRQKVSGIRYEANTAQSFQFNLALALATFNDTREQLASGLAQELQEHQARKPEPPVEAAALAATPASSATTLNTGVLATFGRAPRWLRIALPIVLLLLAIGVIGALAGGGSSGTHKNAASRRAAPIVTAATQPPTTTTTLPPTTVPPSEPPTTVAPPPPPTEAPVAAPPSQQIVHPGAFCSPVGATGVTDAGTPMVCSATSANGTPYTQPRWRSA
jgi:hypothetical protein